jgi:hypothetical protein
MTHTSHRQGAIESLRGDWVVQIRRAKGINEQFASPKLKKFLDLSLKYEPVCAGCSRIGNSLILGWQKLIEDVGNIEDSHNAHVVFDSMDKVARFIEELVQADLGLSVIVSGFHDEIDQMCREAGTNRHTVQYPLGVWGKTELLPHPKILEITTMCGHGTIPFRLVRRVAKAVRSGNQSLEKAAKELGKPCVCGAFNPIRAQTLLQEYIDCTPDRSRKT